MGAGELVVRPSVSFPKIDSHIVESLVESLPLPYPVAEANGQLLLNNSSTQITLNPLRLSMQVAFIFVRFLTLYTRFWNILTINPRVLLCKYLPILWQDLK